MDCSRGESGADSETESFKAMNIEFDETPDYEWSGEGIVCSNGYLFFGNPWL
jgi:hypothetical protein